MRLTAFPTPPVEINRLWYAATADGRIFRQCARNINNAVCLTSLVVKERRFDGGFTPNMVFEGKVTHKVSPLHAAEGVEPRFAQLYVHDPTLETSQRYKNMYVPPNMSVPQKQILGSVLTRASQP